MVKKELLYSSVHHQKLVQTLLLPEKLQQRNPAILFIHGWRSSQQGVLGYAEALAQKGRICMTFDLRGHGSSQGNINLLTRQDFLDDVLTAYDSLLTAVEVDPDAISVVGSSFGGYLAALLTTRRNVKYVALRAPADYPNEGFEQPQVLFSDAKSSVWRMQEHQPHESLALNALHTFSGEVLIVESGKDDQIPHQTIANYINALRDKERLTSVVMKEAGHRLQDHQLRAEYQHILLHWFGAQIGFSTS